MSKLQQYRETERAIKQLQEQLCALDQDSALVKEREFEEKLRALMAEYGVDLIRVVDLLDPNYREKASAVAEKNDNGSHHMKISPFYRGVVFWKRQSCFYEIVPVEDALRFSDDTRSSHMLYGVLSRGDPVFSRAKAWFDSKGKTARIDTGDYGESLVVQANSTDFSERLHAAMAAAGMNRKDLSIRVGLTLTRIANYEAALNKPNTATLSELARALGVEASELVPDELKPNLSEFAYRIAENSADHHQPAQRGLRQ